MKTQTRSAAAALMGGATAPAPVATGRASRMDAPASRIDASLSGGVQHGAMAQAMQPFVGEHATPTGQIINVSMNAPSPHLEFKDWMARGVVGGVGKVAAWPFRLVGMTLESTALAIVDVFKSVIKTALIVVLIPTLFLVGIRLMNKMSESATIEGGAASMMHDGRHAVNGLGKGISDELPPEAPAARPHARTPKGARGER